MPGMAFRRRRPFARRARRALRWTGELTTVEQSTAFSALTYSTIVAVTDYQQQGTLEAAGVTLMRIRGNVTWRSATTGDISMFGIIVLDDTQTPAFSGDTDPGTAGWLRNGDVLWSWYTQTQSGQIYSREIDVKVKRRLQGQQVHFVVSNRGAGTVIWTYGARALLAGG